MKSLIFTRNSLLYKFLCLGKDYKYVPPQDICALIPALVFQIFNIGVPCLVAGGVGMTILIALAAWFSFIIPFPGSNYILIELKLLVVLGSSLFVGIILGILFSELPSLKRRISSKFSNGSLGILGKIYIACKSKTCSSIEWTD